MLPKNIISFHKQNQKFHLCRKKNLSKWIAEVVLKEKRALGDIAFIFCSDRQLNKINHKYLNTNNLTDIITFDYCDGKIISGDIFISVERVRENASLYQFLFLDELHRVMIHGVLHLLGYSDKTKKGKIEMTQKEDLYLSLRPLKIKCFT